MNELTRELVTATAKANKRLAKRNDAEFREAVRIEHWNLMIDLHGARLKNRAMNLLEVWRPEFFDAEGYIHDFADICFDLDNKISWVAVRVLKRKIGREESLQLHTDWGDMPVLIADPQLRFDLNV